MTQEARPGWILYHIFVWCLDIVSHAVDIEEVSPIACDIVLHHVKVVDFRVGFFCKFVNITLAGFFACSLLRIV